MLYRLEGIVIRTTDYGESDRIITLYTPQMGKVGIMAKGARKVRSRLGGTTQLFTYGDYTVFKKGSMGTLNAGESIHSHHLLREDIHLTAYSCYIAEMMDRILPDAEPYPAMFEQLNAALSALEDGKDAAIIIHIMEMKMLAQAGYLPRLEECVECGLQIEPMRLSVGLGGLLCSRCYVRDPQSIVLTPNTLKLLRLFQQMDLRRLGSIEVKPETKATLKVVMRAFFDTYLDVNWKSRNFIDQMMKYDF